MMELQPIRIRHSGSHIEGPRTAVEHRFEAAVILCFGPVIDLVEETAFQVGCGGVMGHDHRPLVQQRCFGVFTVTDNADSTYEEKREEPLHAG